MNKKYFGLRAGMLAGMLLSFAGVSMAELYSPKTDVNSKDADKVVLNAIYPVSFVSGVNSGDLYLAVDINPDPAALNLLFFEDASPLPVVRDLVSARPYKTVNLSETTSLLDMPTENIPPGNYTVYALWLKKGATDLLNPTNHLSNIEAFAFNINLNNQVAVADPVAKGRDLYASTCTESGCHNIDPVRDSRNSIIATSLGKLKQVISKEPEMRKLSSMSDPDLQAIADYLASL